jgi:hypothetical protein
VGRNREKVTVIIPYKNEEVHIGDCLESVKWADELEALGVPHTEIDLILVNGKSVDFNYILQNGD